ncbi:MAG: DUF4861 family protein [Paludibacteraceae bacterium]|nr:DUF4861 family protein [Paludibacteraceae bacterium]
MLRLTKNKLGQLGILGCLGLLVSCTPRVATSFWRIGTPADSTREGYAVLYEGTKMRHCYPITEWTDDPAVDTYHQLHHHGVAVESELMAYRIYFDKKQTIDPYCKRKPQLELAQSYWYPNDSLLAEGYGDDILRVSGTVGVGSVKYWNGTKMVHIEPVAERSQRIVSHKKDQATIEVAVRGWDPRTPMDPSVHSPLVNMTTRYTMCAGHRDMRCDVFLSDTLSGLCTGVQTIPAKGGSDTCVVYLENGILLASWGTDWPVNDSAKYAKETVGLAVFIPYPYAGDIVHDKQNNLCLLKQSPITNHQSPMCATAHFYLTVCGATKENHPVATNATEWLAYLRKWAKGLK